MHFVMHDRRGKLGYESIVVIAVTLAGWLTSAGMMWQHIADVDRRVERLEMKMDKLTEYVRAESRGQAR